MGNWKKKWDVVGGAKEGAEQWHKLKRAEGVAWYRMRQHNSRLGSTVDIVRSRYSKKKRKDLYFLQKINWIIYLYYKRTSENENNSHQIRIHHTPHIGPTAKGRGRWEEV